MPRFKTYTDLQPGHWLFTDDELIALLQGRSIDGERLGVIYRFRTALGTELEPTVPQRIAHLGFLLATERSILNAYRNAGNKAGVESTTYTMQTLEWAIKELRPRT